MVVESLLEIETSELILCQLARPDNMRCIHTSVKCR